jgi:hypothetical protein
MIFYIKKILLRSFWAPNSRNSVFYDFGRMSLENLKKMCFPTKHADQEKKKWRTDPVKSQIYGLLG